MYQKKTKRNICKTKIYSKLQICAIASIKSRKSAIRLHRFLYQANNYHQNFVCIYLWTYLYSEVSQWKIAVWLVCVCVCVRYYCYCNLYSVSLFSTHNIRTCRNTWKYSKSIYFVLQGVRHFSYVCEPVYKMSSSLYLFVLCFFLLLLITFSMCSVQRLSHA